MWSKTCIFKGSRSEDKCNNKGKNLLLHNSYEVITIPPKDEW